MVALARPGEIDGADGELPELESRNRFRINDPAEIGSILRDVVRAGTLVAASFSDGADSYLTVLLDVDPTTEVLVIDAPSTLPQRNRLLASPRVALSFEFHKVYHECVGARPRVATHEGAEVIAVHMPQSLLRYQRRDFFRIEVPYSQPLHARFHEEVGPGNTPLELRVHDVSAGGLALRVKPGQRCIPVGALCHDTSLELPDIGTIFADLEVRNHLPLILKNGQHETKIGCVFRALPPACEIRLQRYINTLQARAQRIRIRGQ